MEDHENTTEEVKTVPPEEGRVRRIVPKKRHEEPKEVSATPEPTETPSVPPAPEQEQEEEKKNYFGRPTKYSPKILEEVVAYIESCMDKTVVEEVFVEGTHTDEGDAEEKEDDEDEGEEGMGFGKRPRYRRKPMTRFDVRRTVKIPTKGGLAVHLKVSRDTLYAWARENQDFSDIMEYLGALQEDRLINKGLSGEYSQTLAKVLLTKHGYREGFDATTNDKDLGSVNEARIAKKADDILNTGA